MQELVGCGRTVLDERLAIVDPGTGARLGTDQIGEIWVSGENIAAAYWRKIANEERLLQETFGAAFEDYRRRSRALIPFLI